jgi:flagellar biosynthetic protein FliP
MFMLPPTVITIPLKLLVFVLASGWPLLLGNLAGSFS